MFEKQKATGSHEPYEGIQQNPNVVGPEAKQERGDTRSAERGTKKIMRKYAGNAEPCGPQNAPSPG